MSGDVFSSMNPDENKPVEFSPYCSIKFTIEDYCTYTGVCKRDRVINRDMTCLFCKYRTPLDIPEMIRKELEK
jgi:hypothetical protein